MTPLVSAPGIIQKAPRLFITQEDVARLLGCGKSIAYQTIHEVNEYAKKKGNHPFPAGRANKYLFSDIYGIPIEEVNMVIAMNEANI